MHSLKNFDKNYYTLNFFVYFISKTYIFLLLIDVNYFIFFSVCQFNLEKKKVLKILYFDNCFALFIMLLLKCIYEFIFRTNIKKHGLFFEGKLIKIF